MPPENAETVFVLGAGFTRAFLPQAPLLVDDYGVDSMLSRFKHLSHIERILGLEKTRNENGYIDIERLMTRLDGRMPYDFDQNTNEEFSLLLRELKNRFRDRFETAKADSPYSDDLSKLAAYCIANKTTCITFNYDNVFDEQLWKLKLVRTTAPGFSYWHPDGGYGFFCRPSQTCVHDTPVAMDRTAMFLLKLHGSINWRLRRGYSPPYVIDAVVHHEPWLPLEMAELTLEDIELHLESEPFIVPPVLVKSTLVEQPVLRLIWSLAFKKLEAAKEVCFIGYSFPVTDLASNFLFSEALTTKDVKVVNFAADPYQQAPIKNAYLKVFPWLRDEQFDLGGRWNGRRSLQRMLKSK